MKPTKTWYYCITECSAKFDNYDELDIHEATCRKAKRSVSSRVENEELNESA